MRRMVESQSAKPIGKRDLNGFKKTQLVKRNDVPVLPEQETALAALSPRMDEMTGTKHNTVSDRVTGQAGSVLAGTRSVQNKDETTKKLGGVTGRGFLPGQSGNPGGRPKKKPLTEALEVYLSANPEEANRIAKAMIDAAKDGSVAHFRELADRLEGRAIARVEVKEDVLSTLAERIERGRKRAAAIENIKKD